MTSLSAAFATPVGLNAAYPWPYSDPNFPGFPEDEDALVTDPAGFVIKRSTSYAAWRIKCLTGSWPLKRAYKGKRYDAKDWGEFLELNGFRALNGERPWVAEMTSLNGLYAYVGIDAKAGEFGQLYWMLSMNRAGGYVCASKGKHAPDEIGYVCTTYQDFKPLTCWIAQNDPDVTWYEYAWDHF